MMVGFVMGIESKHLMKYLNMVDLDSNLGCTFGCKVKVVV